MKTTIEKRLGETQVLDSTTDIVTSEQQNSMKISRNAKGDFAFESKVYNDNLDQMEKDMRAQLNMAWKLISEQKSLS